jgi:hypothetical protein
MYKSTFLRQILIGQSVGKQQVAMRRWLVSTIAVFQRKRIGKHLYGELHVTATKAFKFKGLFTFKASLLSPQLGLFRHTTFGHI